MNRVPENELGRLDRIQQQIAQEYAREIGDLRAALEDTTRGDDAAMHRYWAVQQSLPDADRDEQITLLRDFLEGYETLAYQDGMHPDPVSPLQPLALTAGQDQARAAAVQQDLDLERHQRREPPFEYDDYDDHDDDGYDDGTGDAAWEALAQARHAVDGARASYLRAIPTDTGTGLDTLDNNPPPPTRGSRPDEDGRDDGDTDAAGWGR